MRRRIWVSTAVVVGLLAALLLVFAPIYTARRSSLQRETRNVILIVIDALRADHLGCYGYARETSPHIDSLAGEGILFLNALCQGTWTKSNMGTMLTGLFPSRHGAVDRVDTLSPEAVTLAERLKENGFLTQAFVTNSNIGKAFGFHQGFEDYEEVFRDPALGWMPAGVDFFDRVFRWLRDHGDRRFFLLLFLIEPHEPYDPKPEFDRFTSAPPQGVDGQVKTLSALDGERENITPEVLQRLFDLYDGEIRCADEAVRRLATALAELGLDKDTLVVLTADHGEAFWEHRTRGHGLELYNEQLRVPLIVRLPGGAWGGLRVDSPVATMDIFPTVCEAVDVRPSSGLQGRSLLPLILCPLSRATSRAQDFLHSLFVQAGLYFPPSRVVVSETDLDGHRFQAVTTPRIKLIRDRDAWRHELYDLVADPGEKSDLAGRRWIPEAVLRLHLKRWNKKYGGTSTQAKKRIELDEATSEQLRALGYIQ